MCVLGVSMVFLGYRSGSFWGAARVFYGVSSGGCGVRIWYVYVIVVVLVGFVDDIYNLSIVYV